MNRNIYRKKSLSEPAYSVTYVDNFNKEHCFKSTKSMLNSHRMLLSNNSYVKSFKVEPLVKEN